MLVANLISFPATEKNNINLQKDVISTQNGQVVRKGVTLCKMASMKKTCEIQVVAKKWLSW